MMLLEYYYFVQCIHDLLVTRSLNNYQSDFSLHYEHNETIKNTRSALHEFYRENTILKIWKIIITYAYYIGKIN